MENVAQVDGLRMLLFRGGWSTSLDLPCFRGRGQPLDLLLGLGLLLLKILVC
jgi:hypothetical protein